MEGTGLSLFQGSEGLQIQTPEEEEEDEEDQKRRNEELHDLLTNAFDDLMDDEDDFSVDSSLHSQTTHGENEGSEKRLPAYPIPRQALVHLGGAGDNSEVSQHYTHCFKKSPFEDRNQQTDYGSKEQLEVLYEVRLREVQRLKDQLESVTQEAAQEKDQIYRRLALAQAEKERTTSQYANCNRQLDSSKTRILELEKELETLKLNLSNVEQSNVKLTRELDVALMSVKDLEKKMSLAEHGGNGKMTDLFLRGIQEKHERELHDMKTQVNSLAVKYNVKDDECDALQKQLRELNEKHEEFLVEKSGVINRLMAELAESQQQCQKYIKNMNNVESEELQKQVHKLQAELDSVHGDLKHYEDMAQCGLLNSEDSNSFNMNHKTNPSNDLNIKLRDELQRCLAGLKMKREEIKRLKNQLENRDEVICKLREQEAAYLAQANDIKQDATNLMEQLHKYQMGENKGHDTRKCQLQIAQLQTELSAVKEEKGRLEAETLVIRQQSIEEKLKAIDQRSEEYIQWHDKAVARVRQEANQQIQSIVAEFRLQLEQAEKQCVEVKQQYIELCSSKEKLLESVEKEKEANREIDAKLQEAQVQLHNLQTKLNEEMQKCSEAEDLLKAEKEKVTSLQLELQTTQKEVEKAQQKQLQLSPKQVDTRDEASSPFKDDTKQEEILQIVASLEAKHQQHLEQVKHESVQCLANELSACEARHRQQLEQAEEEYARNLASFRSLIDNKTQEVEVLKKAMLKERDKLRAERESCQAEEMRKEMEQRLQTCDQEWRSKLAEQSDEWRGRLTSYQQEVDSERDKMAQAIAGWAEELQTLQKEKQESEAKVAELQNKYESAKKTARRYKVWADGKEKHVEREWRRICVAFQNALEALHSKAEAALARKEGDQTIVKQLDNQIQELQKKLVQFKSI